MDHITKRISDVGWNFDNTYSRLPSVLLSRISPIPVKSPKLIILNKNLSEQLGLDFLSLDKENLALLFSGNFLPKGSDTIAQAYAGHQFGHFTILGDGRAIMIGEHLSKDNKRYDIQFKGSGVTPYSRNGDGRAALGPMLREYIISEAMNNLNILTTRSLAVVATGENVIREKPLTGAILTRVASSHLRVGTFQYALVKGDLNILKSLVDYSIDRHYPDLKNENNKAISLLSIVMKKQIDLITDWMRVGFIHGVMNTDNMTISGETIDYGPCAFIDTYDPETVFSSIDHAGRYAYINQPGIAKWNLLRFAETLLPLIDEKKERAIKIAEDIVNNFGALYKESWLKMMRKKIGLFGEDLKDEVLITDLLKLMSKKKYDYTNTFCLLMRKDKKNEKLIKDSDFIDWHKRWNDRLKTNNKPFDLSLKAMKEVNPFIIPRNYKVEESLDAINNNGDLTLFNKLLKALEKPYDDSSENSEYQLEPKGNSKDYKTYCGT